YAFQSASVSDRLKRHPGPDAGRPRCSALADEPGGRQARIREGDRDVMGVERIAQPAFGERARAAHAEPEVSERVRALARGVRIVVEEVAIGDDLGPAVGADRSANDVRILDAEIG